MANLRTTAGNLPIALYETTTNLGIGGEFKTPSVLTAGVTPATDDWIDTRGLSDVRIEIAADQVSADLGFTIDETPDPSDAAFTSNRYTATIAADTPIEKHFIPKYRYMRAKYINGGVAQGSFVLFVTGSQQFCDPSHHHMDEYGNATYEFLKDGAEVDLSVVTTTANYDYTLGPTEYFEIERVLFRGGDDSKGLPNSFFGISALSNGLLLQILDDSPAIVEHFTTDDVPIKEHFDLSNLAGVDVGTDSISNLSGIGSRWTISKSGKRVLMKPGWTLRVVVQDDISALRLLRVSVQGLKATSYEFS